jgi:phytoene dehydrogenase-like protein
LSEAIVIGGDADGLVAAHVLARGGHRVTVIVDRPTQRAGGWVAPALAQDLGVTSPEPPEPWLRAPLLHGGVLELSRDTVRSADAIRRISPRDAERWPRFCDRMATLARLLEEVYLGPPPSLIDLRFALRVRRLGRGAMEEMMRLLPMPAAELLDDWFESDELKGALAAFAVRNVHQGPRSAGTAFVLLHHHVGNPPGVFRPPRSNLMAQLGARPGVALRVGKPARIAVRGGRATGVMLQSGEELAAELIVSALAPRRTLGELLEPGCLDPDLVRAVRHIRARGVAATVALTLERPAAFSTLTLAPSVDYVERAYDDVKYGRASVQPWIDVVANDVSAEMHCQYLPYGSPPELGPIVQKVAPHLPPIKNAQWISHDDWPGGQPLHAELALDQALWMRPLPELSGYRTPIEGLWLGGPAMHPGIPGLCGYNCARQIMRA